MKACVIIPTHNESKEIGWLVDKIRLQRFDVLVVDDGSADATAQVAEAHGAAVIRNERNLGKGASLIKGFGYALEREYDAVITMDGDGQHRPEDIPNFIRCAASARCAMVIGNRMQQTKNMPLERRITNALMSWLISLIAKQKIPDTQCGFRLIKRDVLKNVQFITANIEIESEMIIKAARAGFVIESVPIETVYNGEKSRIHPVKDTIRFIKFVTSV